MHDDEEEDSEQECLAKPKKQLVQQPVETHRAQKDEIALESKRKPRGRRQKKKDMTDEKQNLRYIIDEESKRELYTHRKKTSTSDLIYDTFMSARQGGRPRLLEKSSKRP